MVKAGPGSTDKGEKDDASLRTSECDYGVASHSSGRRQTFQLSRPEMPDCLSSVEPDPSFANDGDLLNRASQSAVIGGRVDFGWQNLCGRSCSRGRQTILQCGVRRSLWRRTTRADFGRAWIDSDSLQLLLCVVFGPSWIA